jgi:peptide/nickel transport system substrate-binding protein
MLGNVYEGLTKRDKELKIIPGLAERWEVVEPTRWRFFLRKGVKFSNGEDFTAEDVVFSADRARMPASDVKTRLPADVKVVKVDDHTVDFILASPNPILHYEWDTWYILSKKWAEANGSAQPQPQAGQQMSYAALHANGTGPFIITEHQAGVKTVFKPNPKWWGKPEHNFDEVVFTTISNDATRVAALLSGDVDWADPIPLQDIERINASANAQVMQGPELRTIFLSFDQYRDELKYSNVKGKNPFKDVRVRKAFYLAIDENAIADKVMRKAAVPSALMISPLLFPLAKDFKRPAYAPEEAKKLLAEAGYPNGFEFTLDCPNNRYVNDEKICQAVVAMLAKIGVKINLKAQTRNLYFAKILRKNDLSPGETSFYMLGWSPAQTYDVHNVFEALIQTPNKATKKGQFNAGGYSNPKIDELADKMEQETDKAKRDAEIAEATKLYVDDFAYIPLHQQALVWATRKNIDLVQPADNSFPLRYVNVK